MPNVVIKQAYLEDETQRKLVREASRKRGNKPKNVPVTAFLKKVVSLDEEPPCIEPFSGILPRNVRTTNGFFSLVYNPEGSPKRVKDKPYTFGQDLFAAKISVSGPRHLKALGTRIPEIGWILKWSNFDDRLFALAKKHPGVAFGFNVRWADYAEMIERKAEQEGIDIDHKPFLMYVTTATKMKELREKYKMMPPPTKEDYQTVLDEVDEKILKKEVNVYGKHSSDDD